MSTVKVLFVHGVSNFEQIGWDNQSPRWKDGIQAVLDQAFFGAGVDFEFDYLEFDRFFDRDPILIDNYARALVEMGYDWLTCEIEQSVKDFWSKIFGKKRGLLDGPPVVRWTAGMVAQWGTEKELRSNLRAEFFKKLNEFQPHIVIGHSLGGLLTYDAMIRKNPGSQHEFAYVTVGTQIGHCAVRETFGGVLRYPNLATEWIHAFNPNDWIFTSPIRLTPDSRFTQYPISPVGSGLSLDNHKLETYLLRDGFPQVLQTLAVRMATGERSMGEVTRLTSLESASQGRLEDVVEGRVDHRFLGEKATGVGLAKPTTRALLVGINKYKLPGQDLEGCVNDVFEVSSCLQEMGFGADDIRIVLDERATTQGVIDRLDWLLEDVRPGDVRLLYFSGHGVRIPGYGSSAEPDRLIETLVTHDFDFKQNLGITDKNLARRYGNLPYEASFTIILDCCHSGGMTRGEHRVRGLNPPDDIRHRMLKWDAKSEMWISRSFDPLSEELNEEKGKSWFGVEGAIERIGVASQYRIGTQGTYKDVRDEVIGKGPFMPMVIYACADDQLAVEYRHGVTSYGAFTFALTRKMRQEARRSKGGVTAKGLVTRTIRELRRLGYEQSPGIVGPTTVLEQELKFFL